MSLQAITELCELVTTLKDLFLQWNNRTHIGYNHQMREVAENNGNNMLHQGFVSNYPTMGLLKPNLRLVCSISLARSSCGRSVYLRNCPIHQTIGAPWSRINRGARSSGIDNGMYGGRGWSESTIGRSTTWISFMTSGAAKKQVCKPHCMYIYIYVYVVMSGATPPPRSYITVHINYRYTNVSYGPVPIRRTLLLTAITSLVRGITGPKSQTLYARVSQKPVFSTNSSKNTSCAAVPTYVPMTVSSSLYDPDRCR